MALYKFFYIVLYIVLYYEVVTMDDFILLDYAEPKV